VECPIGFARVGGGELCLRRFGGADGTPPLAHAAAREFCRAHFDAQLPAPRTLAAHRAALTLTLSLTLTLTLALALALALAPTLTRRTARPWQRATARPPRRPPQP
jgi:hypothetical protein